MYIQNAILHYVLVYLVNLEGFIRPKRQKSRNLHRTIQISLNLEKAIPQTVTVL